MLQIRGKGQPQASGRIQSWEEKEWAEHGQQTGLGHERRKRQWWGRAREEEKTERGEERARGPREPMADMSGLCRKESWGKGREAPGLEWLRVENRICQQG